MENSIIPKVYEQHISLPVVMSIAINQLALHYVMMKPRRNLPATNIMIVKLYLSIFHIRLAVNQHVQTPPLVQNTPTRSNYPQQISYHVCKIINMHILN